LDASKTVTATVLDQGSVKTAAATIEFKPNPLTGKATSHIYRVLLSLVFKNWP